MPNTITGGSPEIQGEIESALDELKKNNYKAVVQENGDELDIRFEFGANDQTLKFKQGDWRTAGAVQKKIVDDLDI